MYLFASPGQKSIVVKLVYKVVRGPEANTPLSSLFLPFLPVLARPTQCFAFKRSDLLLHGGKKRLFCIVA